MNNPTHGWIVYPYCNETIADGVKFCGQSMSCPKRRGVSTAPGGNAQAIQAVNLVGALVTVATGIAPVALGRGCL